MASCYRDVVVVGWMECIGGFRVREAGTVRFAVTAPRRGRSRPTLVVQAPAVPSHTAKEYNVGECLCIRLPLKQFFVLRCL